MFSFHKKIFLFSFFLFFLNIFPAHAQPNNNQHIVVAPLCLTKNLSASHEILASNNSLSLVSVNEQGIHQLIKAKNNRKAFCGGFMDVTKAWKEQGIVKNNAETFLNNYSQPNHSEFNNSYEIKYQVQVNNLLKQINPQNMWDNLVTLSNFQDRYANSDNGVRAAEWIKTQVEMIAKNTNHEKDVSVYFISTKPSYKQPSVVAKFGNSNEPGIVIGAHMDTLNSTFSKKPGADDDGSGSVTVLETVRTILSSTMTFNKPIYFIWYAAEEQGLVGSGNVVAEFKKQNIPVSAVLHFDLTGYAHNNETTMWLIDDYVNKDLVTFLGNLITTYIDRPVKHTACGYACSDHASWTQAGYPAAIPAESSYDDTNPYIHSSRDTLDNLSLNHMTDYLKLATAFAVEMAEPK